MTAYRAFTMLLIALAALAGCKKKPATNPELQNVAGPNVPIPDLLDSVPEPGLSADEVIAALNHLAEGMNAGQRPSFEELTHLDWRGVQKGPTGLVRAPAGPKWTRRSVGSCRRGRRARNSCVRSGFARWSLG